MPALSLLLSEHRNLFFGREQALFSGTCKSCLVSFGDLTGLIELNGDYMRLQEWTFNQALERHLVWEAERDRRQWLEDSRRQRRYNSPDSSDVDSFESVSS